MPTARELLQIVVEADTADAGQQMDGLLGRLAGPAGMATAAAAAGAAIAAFAADTLGAADEIAGFADRANFGAEELQVLGRIAEAGGGSIEDVADAAREMQLRLAEAALDGAGPAATALVHLGISIDDIRGLAPERQFAMLRDAISDVVDPAERLFLAEELLGGSTERLNSLLSIGSDAYAERAAAVRENQILTEAEIDAADRAHDAWQDATAAVTAAAQSLIIELAPAIEVVAGAVQTMTEYTDTMGDVWDLVSFSFLRGAGHWLAFWRDGEQAQNEYFGTLDAGTQITSRYVGEIDDLRVAFGGMTAEAIRAADALDRVTAAQVSLARSRAAQISRAGGTDAGVFAPTEQGRELGILSAAQLAALRRYGASEPAAERGTLGGHVVGEGDALDADRTTVQRPEDSDPFYS